MPLVNPTDRTVNFDCAIRFNEDGTFKSAYRIPTYQVLSAGEVVAKREDPPVPLTLAQLKTFVANLT